MDAVADEDDGRILDADVGLSCLIGDGVIGLALERCGLACGRQRKGALGLCRDVDHGDPLRESPLAIDNITRGLEAEQRELREHIPRRKLSAACTRATAFQQIISKEACVSGDALGGDFLHRLERGRWHAGDVRCRGHRSLLREHRCGAEGEKKGKAHGQKLSRR